METPSAIALGIIIGLFVGITICCLCRSGKINSMHNQIETMSKQCDGCGYYQDYLAAKADCRALEEEIAIMRRSYDNVRRVNKGLVRLTNARA